MVKDTDPIEKRSSVCTRSVAVAVGRVTEETKRSPDTNLKEHKAATRQGEVHKSASAEHAWTHHYQLWWDETRVLDVAVNNTCHHGTFRWLSLEH